MNKESVPGPVAMINGMVQGLAEAHIGEMPEENIKTLLSWVIGEITYWRDGEKQIVNGETQTNS